MHVACGRREKSVIDCIRNSAKVWRVMKVIVQELTDCSIRMDRKGGRIYILDTRINPYLIHLRLPNPILSKSRWLRIKDTYCLNHGYITFARPIL